MLPTKFRVIWPFGSGEEAKNRFSRWLPWQPSWISYWNDFRAIVAPNDGRRMMDIDWSQQLTLSTLCSGELKRPVQDLFDDIYVIFFLLIFFIKAYDMLWVLIWIASTSLCNSNGLPQHMKSICYGYSSELHQQVNAIQIGTHNICLYKM